MKRGLEFPPPYGRELPLPSDLKNSHKQFVFELLALWMVIKREKGTSHNVQSVVITHFFDELSEEQGFWLEDQDPRFHRPRAVLVKERAIQLYQRNDLSLLDREELAEKITAFRSWVSEAKKVA